MSEEKGIKETQEALAFLVEVLKELGPIFRDGAQWSDAALLFAAVQKPDVKAKLDAAVAGANEVPAEMKDISFVEGFALAQAILPELPAIMAAWKKPE